jgi:hypothetical protein
MGARRVVAAGVVLAVTWSSVAALATPPVDDDGDLGSVLDRPRRGEDALARLGDRLPAVAALNGMRADDVRDHLRSDETLWVDPTGRLFYVEPEAAGTTEAAETTLAAPFPLADTFLLHSRPGANRVLYLDFDGHTVAGTAWNTSATGSSFYAEPYDADGNPSSFSDAEREQIQLTWARMAEDYAPFDVDVTTQDPGFDAINRSGSSDSSYGTRVLISAANEYSSICPNGCGGVAYVGTFDYYGSLGHAYYQPAWVFTQGVGTGAKNVAEAGSHEAGHNLGLSHDGTATLGYYRGHGAWAPIMGVGYYEPISQWSRGEYSGANNTQDDFAVIQANGGPLRSDDAGGTTSAAASLGSGPSLAFQGVISTRADVDVFAFTAGDGPAVFSVQPAATGANLDVKLELLSASGSVLGASDPPSGQVDAGTATGLDATISTTLTAGTYYLRVDGVGYGDPASTGYSDYGSVGAYTLTGTITTGTSEPPPPPPDEQPPAAPALVTVSGSRNVTISWTAVTGATRYDVQRQKRLSNGTFDSPTLIRDDLTTTSTSDRPGAGTWVYSVRAENSVGSSAWTFANPITTKR